MQFHHKGESAPAALECRALSKRYGSGRVVLDHLDFTLAPGEFVAIMGDSGVGKSTLLNLIAGLDQADGGEVIIGGTAVSRGRNSDSCFRRFMCCRISRSRKTSRCRCC